MQFISKNQNKLFLPFLCFFFNFYFAFSADTKKPIENDLTKECKKFFAQMPRALTDELLHATCSEVKMLESCKSEEGRPLFHFEKKSENPKALNILVFALTHGDEPESSTIAMNWMNRLRSISPRSHWRVVPLLNPDGFLLKTRMNKNGVDINRNYPTKDWDPEALKRWQGREKSDPRRNPGKTAGSESETMCSIKHIEDFNPDFVISLHTPYGLLDFDGPKLKFPFYYYLPWKSLGNFPGSLGRYLWHERKIPVVTVELKNLDDFKDIKKMDELQDMLGTVAIQSQQQK